MNDCAPGSDEPGTNSGFSESGFVEALRQMIGNDGVVNDAEAMTPYTHDWTGNFSGPALAVALPQTTVHVAAILELCGRMGVAVLPQGGNTGLVGGSVPAQDSAVPTLILSTKRLTEPQEVDLASRTVRVGAGVTIAQVQQQAKAAGLYYGVDLASRDSATVGGTIATNAGGIRVCAFGMTRHQIAGLEAVLPSGEVVSSMRGLTKDNTGYDLPSLLCGSEGTLGVITQVMLRLRTEPGRSAVVLLGVADLDEAVKIYDQASRGAQVLAAEVMDLAGTEQVCELADLPWPLESKPPYLLLIEWELGSSQAEAGVTAEADLPAWIPTSADAVLGFDANDIERLWVYRERQSEAAQLLPNREAGQKLIKLDVSIPHSRLAEFDRTLRTLIAPEKLGVFGHIGDGNLHVEIAATPAETDAATRAVLEEVGSLGGSISGEHGIGRVKVPYLELSRSPAELSAMRSIKSALDPQGIMAPGVIFND